MDKSIYVSMTGASEVFTAQAVKANNLANLSTPGFKAALVNQQTTEIYGDGLPTRAYAQSDVPGYDLSEGTVRTTGNDLDVAIKGDGWLVVTNEEGEQGLTRRGDLSLNSNGELVNGAGFYIEGAGGRIVIPPSEAMSIAEDGQISVVPIGADPSTKVIIDKIKLTNVQDESTLRLREDTLFDQGDGSSFEDDISVLITSGALESSNVNAVNELVDLISLTRKYELDVKMMSTAKENDESLAQLLHI